MENGNYKKFLLLLGLSFLIMYSIMYFNVDKFDHIRISLNRFYMAILMATPMAVIMLGGMSSMYKNKKLNIAIMSISIVIFITAFLLLRNQGFINDKQFMESMIPHHSSAILVSKEASLNDPEVKKLARQIIESQEREIEQMKNILKRME